MSRAPLELLVVTALLMSAAAPPLLAEPPLSAADSQDGTGAAALAGVQLASRAGESAPGGQPTASEGGGFDPLALFRGARRVFAGNDVTLTQAQRQRLQGMRPALSELSGPDGAFGYDDVPDVVKSLEPQLSQRVRQEISRRANAEIQKGRFPAVRGIFVRGHLNRNYCNYFEKGMGQARGMVDSGLGEFLGGVGTERGQVPQSPFVKRNLTLSQLDDFRAGAETLREIDRARNAPVRVVFPRGFGVRDLDSLLENPNRVPPGGKVRMR